MAAYLLTIHGPFERCEQEHMSECQCPFIDDCPMVGFVGEGAIRSAMRRLLCQDTFEECIWLRIKVDSPLPRQVILARMERELHVLSSGLCA